MESLLAQRRAAIKRPGRGSPSSSSSAVAPKPSSSGTYIGARARERERGERVQKASNIPLSFRDKNSIALELNATSQQKETFRDNRSPRIYLSNQRRRCASIFVGIDTSNPTIDKTWCREGNSCQAVREIETRRKGSWKNLERETDRKIDR